MSKLLNRTVMMLFLEKFSAFFSDCTCVNIALFVPQLFWTRPAASSWFCWNSLLVYYFYTARLVNNNKIRQGNKIIQSKWTSIEVWILRESVIVINNVWRHKNAIRKGPHLFYCSDAVFDGYQLSKLHLIIWQFCSFALVGCPSWRKLLKVLIRS